MVNKNEHLHSKFFKKNSVHSTLGEPLEKGRLILYFALSGRNESDNEYVITPEGKLKQYECDQDNITTNDVDCGKAFGSSVLWNLSEPSWSVQYMVKNMSLNVAIVMQPIQYIPHNSSQLEDELQSGENETDQVE